MIHVFCTRWLKESIIEDALQRQICIHAENFIKIAPIHSNQLENKIVSALSSPHITLLFSSKNAVSIAFKNYLNQIPEKIISHWKYYVLSGATRQQVLQYAGEDQIIAYANCAADLCKEIKQDKKPIHFFCSNRRRNTLPNFMTRQQIPFKEWEIYKTEIKPHRIDKTYDAFLFYSPSAVESFFSMNKIINDKPCFCIGQTTASAVQSKVDNPVFISEEPNTQQLLQLVCNHFNKENHVKK